MSEKMSHRQEAGQSNHKKPRRHERGGEYDGPHRSGSKDRRDKRREQREVEHELVDHIDR